ncbi:MAG TPA: DUF1499 domain-containing protein [Sphingomicrobium sp.]|nr:DUF1499 domain-containing protein [Sphingomicrobium sp.]
MKTGSNWQRPLSRFAALLSLGGIVAALVASVGSGMGLWHFRVGFGVLRYAFYAAAAGGVLALVGLVAGLARTRAVGKLNLLSFVAALLFSAYLLQLVATARSVPAIHEATTNLDDRPAFTALRLRPDYLEKVPHEGRPELARLDPESRWKAIHRRDYADLVTLRVPGGIAETTDRAAALARSRGWDIARVDRNAGIVEATATSFFFRFKDDVVVRVRPDPARPGGSLVDMRSISRVGGSDVGVNARRIRAFLADLQANAAPQSP